MLFLFKQITRFDSQEIWANCPDVMLFQSQNGEEEKQIRFSYSGFICINIFDLSFYANKYNT
jgi:hypothetical protein